jgi:hypothetical protein
MQPTEAELKAAVDPQILTDLVLANRILYALGVVDAAMCQRGRKRPDHPRALAPALVKAEDHGLRLRSGPVADAAASYSSASSTVKSIGWRMDGVRAAIRRP